MIPCPIKHLIGYECPGCGIQRSVKFIAELKFKESFEIYPPLILCVGFMILVLLFKVIFKRRLNTNLIIKGNLLIVIINYISKLLF